MKIVNYIINKLAGYDVNSKQQELYDEITALRKECTNLRSSCNELNIKLNNVNEDNLQKNTCIDELQSSLEIREIEKKVLESELSVAGAKIEGLNENVLLINRQLNAYKANYTKIKNKKEELQIFLNETNENFQKLKNEYCHKNTELISLQTKFNELGEENKTFYEKLRDLNSTLEIKSNEILILKNDKTALDQELKRVENILVQKDQTLLHVQEENNKLQINIQEINDIVVDKNIELENLNNTCLNLQDQLQRQSSISDEIQNLENQLQSLQEQLSDKCREIDILNYRIGEKENVIQQLENSLTESCDQIKHYRKEHELSLKNISKKDNEIQELLKSIAEKEKDDKNTYCESNLVDLIPQEECKSEYNIISDIKQEEVLLTNQGANADKPEIVLNTNIKDVKLPKITVSLDGNAKSTRKSKEDEIIEMSGDSIIDFPAITNDSNRYVQRSIEFVYDKYGEVVYANTFFDGSAEDIARKSRQLAEDGMVGKADFVCGMCHRPVRIAHRMVNGKESLFFAHAVKYEYCPWIPYSTSSKDEEMVVDNYDGDINFQEKSHSRELKEMIFSLLNTSESSELCVTEVKCDAIIRSSVPYMKWRRPDISFRYNDRNVVIILQREKHDIGMLVDRDMFFRLNNYHVIWLFGADNDVTYDYMRLSNFKNTMFDCHRNVFVFDKEAQRISSEKRTFCFKYNWLDENDNWFITQEKNGNNGFIADISDFIFDDEYCKPYIKEANEAYFKLHPDAEKHYIKTKKSREDLLKEFEEKWKGTPSYEDALRVMKLNGNKATPFQCMGFWGFRFNNTTLIQPVFTEQPVDLQNGYMMVKQGETVGIINYYAEMVVDWTMLQCDELNIDISNKKVMFCKLGMWGIADLMGNILIHPQFSIIEPWSDSIYKVCVNNRWGLYSINNYYVTECIYDTIGDLDTISGRAEATKLDFEKSWIVYSGYINAEGKEIDTRIINLNDKYIAFEQFSKWGVRDIDGEILVPNKYQEILPWDECSVKIKVNDKWGVFNFELDTYILNPQYDSISELKDGKAWVKYAGITNVVDCNGDILSEENVKLQDGYVKSKVGGKWGIEKNGEIIVQHKYDEIGSFRQRLIGVINKSVVKLNAYYDYQIPIVGKCINVKNASLQININGVICVLPMSFLKNIGLENNIRKGQSIENLAFGNLIFGQQKYILKTLTKVQMHNKTCHGDKDSDFNMNEVINGCVSAIMKYKTPNGKIKITKLKLKTDDGRVTMIPRRFFNNLNLDIRDYQIGDNIQIQKVGFDDELDQTKWKIIV